uniref:RimM N-terminal domain-containing protein n=1 Tax=Eutreptiella gymnastica TaxID=73025 RepID=A0A7S1J4X4_9EUGL
MCLYGQAEPTALVRAVPSAAPRAISVAADPAAVPAWGPNGRPRDLWYPGPVHTRSPDANPHPYANRLPEHAPVVAPAPGRPASGPLGALGWGALAGFLLTLVLGGFRWGGCRRTEWALTSFTAESQQKKEKKEKKNKYAQFSKVADRQLDPLEELEKQAEEFKAEQEKQQEKLKPPPPSVSPKLKKGAAQVILPDNPEALDPYDPLSFGFVEVGYIWKPHGLKGEIKVVAVSDFGHERLCNPGVTNLKAPNRRFPRPRIIESGKHQIRDSRGDVFIVKLAGVDTVEEAALLRGYQVFCSYKDKPEVEQDEYLVTDLMGLTVIDHVTGDVLGTCSAVVLGEDMCGTPGLMGDMLEVTLDDDTLNFNQVRTVLIPLAPQFVPVVDLKERRIEVELIEGLLETSVVWEQEVVIKGLLPAPDQTSGSKG